MSVYALIGTQWGDEGKGKVIDFLSAKISYVVRFHGGDNAGHTIIVNNKKYVFHLLPSGVLRGAICIIGPGTVVNLKILIKELALLRENEIKVEIKISDKAHIIMPYHIKIDELKEEKRGEGKIGTTKRGIGPCYADKINREGLRLCDLEDFESFSEKLKLRVDKYNEYFTKLYNTSPLIYEDILKDFHYLREKVKGFITNTGFILNQALSLNKAILFEGAQGTMLDIEHGTYPYVTSSSTLISNITSGAEFPLSKVKFKIGVVKAYLTRVGEGPLVSEISGALSRELVKRGGEYGSTTKRERRVAWLDLVVLKRSIELNELNILALTKLDVLSFLDEIKVLVAYKRGAELINYVPTMAEDLNSLEAVYKTFKGWKREISNVKTYEDLPLECKQYIEFLEEELNLKFSLISVGPQRGQTIFKDKSWINM